MQTQLKDSILKEGGHIHLARLNVQNQQALAQQLQVLIINFK